MNAAWSLERVLSRLLGATVNVALCREALPVGILSPGEQARIAGFRTPARQAAWRRGRYALKRLLGRFGEDRDTAAIAFPNARFSLTHSGRVAVAAGISGGRPLGFGIDFEAPRTLPGDSARFFLTEAERSALLRGGGGRMHLLRLWTVKEALFKACPGNARRVLLDFVVADPLARHGVGRAVAGGLPEMRYASVAFDGGFLSAALVKESGHA